MQCLQALVVEEGEDGERPSLEQLDRGAVIGVGNLVNLQALLQVLGLQQRDGGCREVRLWEGGGQWVCKLVS